MPNEEKRIVHILSIAPYEDAKKEAKEIWNTIWVTIIVCLIAAYYLIKYVTWPFRHAISIVDGTMGLLDKEVGTFGACSAALVSFIPVIFVAWVFEDIYRNLVKNTGIKRNGLVRWLVMMPISMTLCTWVLMLSITEWSSWYPSIQIARLVGSIAEDSNIFVALIALVVSAIALCIVWCVIYFIGYLVTDSFKNWFLRYIINPAGFLVGFQVVVPILSLFA